MINARARLFGHLRGFVETCLPGLITWNDVEAMDGEDAPREPKYGRRNPLGDYREIAAIAFRGYLVRVLSPEEAPPLGSVELRRDGVLIDEGPIDQATWARLGRTIKDLEAAQ